MISGIVLVYTWAVILLACGIGLTVLGAIFLSHGRKYKKMQEKLVKSVEVRTRKEYNKIATMSPRDLGDYLSAIFVKLLEVEAQTRVSEKDHEATEKLYIYTLAAMLDYLGPETVEAIDYYYGKDYVQRWSQYTYRLIEVRRLTDGIIQKTTPYNLVLPNMM